MEGGSESLASIRERIDAARSDLATLASIDAELARRSEPKARILRFHIVTLKKLVNDAAKTSAANVSSRPAMPPTPARSQGPWHDLLTRIGVTRPDGRPLHRYRLNDTDIGQIESILKAGGRSALDQRQLLTAPLFVLWAAHWFQRRYAGGIRKWEDLGIELGLALRHRACIDAWPTVMEFIAAAVR